jgi:hypothetical protein
MTNDYQNALRNICLLIKQHDKYGCAYVKQGEPYKCDERAELRKGEAALRILCDLQGDCVPRCSDRRPIGSVS